MEIDLETIGDVKIPKGALSSDSVVFVFGCLVGEIVSSIIKRYNCRVIGYEPYVKIFKENLEPLSQKYPNFLCINEAVWSSTCRKYFYNYISAWINKSNYPFGANGLIVRSDKFHKIDEFGNLIGVEPLEVQCRGINECLKDYPKIDLVCFDIEMSEFEVLPSITEETLRKICNIYVEFHSFVMEVSSKKYSEDDLNSILLKLSLNGFSYIKLGSHPDYLFYRN